MKLLSVLLIGLFSTIGMQAQQSLQVKLVSLTISGTSSLHDWTSSASKLEGKSTLNMVQGELKSIPAFSVSIPVKSIKSTKGSIMDGKTYDALKADKHPNITYQLVQVKSLEKVGSQYKIMAFGNLTIAGVTKAVDILVTGKVLANGMMEFTGEKALLMTTFNIQPPTAMMGTLKTGDAITIRFTVQATNANSSK